jgi:hypothetical protein
MPRPKPGSNGATTARVDRLEEALSTMLLTQANFLSRTAEMDREMGAMRRDLDDMRTTMNGFAQQLDALTYRFDAVTHQFDALTKMIERLPDAVKEKVGFRG